MKNRLFDQFWETISIDFSLHIKHTLLIFSVDLTYYQYKSMVKFKFIKPREKRCFCNDADHMTRVTSRANKQVSTGAAEAQFITFLQIYRK